MAMVTGGGLRGVEAVLAAMRPTAYAFVMLGLCVLVGMVEGYDAQAMAFAAPLVSKSWGLQPSMTGLLLATSIFGMVIGSFTLAPLGDRWGRRSSILLALFVTGLATMSGAVAPDPLTLLGTRFAAGLALGLAFPNVIALAMELMPARLRTLAIVLVGCGYPLGGAIGGITAASLISDYGYAAVFVLGGAATLIVALVCATSLPESPMFLAKSGGLRRKLETLIVRLGGTISSDADLEFTRRASAAHSNVQALFEPGRRWATILLWIVNFANLLLVYYFVTWLPAILVSVDKTPQFGAAALSLLSAAGMVGGLGFAFLLPRLGATRTLSGAYILATVGALWLSSFTVYEGAFLVALVIAAMGIVGSQFCLNAVVNHFYPTEIRATAAGYATGAGRLGAVAAPFVGSVIMSSAASAQLAFGIAILPAMVALAGVIVLGRFFRVNPSLADHPA